MGKEEVLKLIERVTRNDESLTSLDLAFALLKPAEVVALAEALKTNTCVTSLNLWGNSICTEAIVALAEVLKTNTGLTSLDLWANSIRTEGAVALASALKVNTGLMRLNLAYNSTGPEGAVAIAEALVVNQSLSTLIVRNTLLDSDGCCFLRRVSDLRVSAFMGRREAFLHGLYDPNSVVYGLPGDLNIVKEIFELLRPKPISIVYF